MVINDFSTVRVFDPACGSGNFLLSLSNKDLCLEQLYGQDIDEIAIELARINMALNMPVMMCRNFVQTFHMCR